MGTIEFRREPVEEEDYFDAATEQEPDYDAMDLSEMLNFRKRIVAAIDKLNREEPNDEESEEHDYWCEDHEELEDILDEIDDRVELLQRRK